MKRIFALGFVVGLVVQASLGAKGLTTKITIADQGLGTQIDITDPILLKRFNVWDGRGTFATVDGRETEGTQGFIIDWLAGAIGSKPQGLHRYEVRFYVRHHNTTADELAYVVFYERDPSSREGFVYLPGKSDEPYQLNVRAIHRGPGFEGNWFRASPAWQDAVERVMKAR